MRVNVLMKQHPLLSSAKTEICMDEGLKYSLTNLEKNTHPCCWVYYYMDNYEYGDGTVFSTGRNSYDDFDNWITYGEYSNTFKNVEKR
jgi:hypothetical protein